jgi:hypothetical protein
MTTLGELPEERLRRRFDVMEDEYKRVEATEYCLHDCAGIAHKHQYKSWAEQGCYCTLHVRRDVTVVMKRWPEGGMDGFTASF